jgi:hypothetical protein
MGQFFLPPRERTALRVGAEETTEVAGFWGSESTTPGSD